MPGILDLKSLISAEIFGSGGGASPIETSTFVLSGLSNASTAIAYKNGKTIEGVYDNATSKMVIRNIPTFGTWKIDYTDNGLANSESVLIESAGTYPIETSFDLVDIYSYGDTKDIVSGGWTFPNSTYPRTSYQLEAPEFNDDHILLKTRIGRGSFNATWYFHGEVVNSKGIDPSKYNAVKITYSSDCEVVAKIHNASETYFTSFNNEYCFKSETLPSSNGEVATVTIDLSDVTSPYQVWLSTYVYSEIASQAKIFKVTLLKL